MEKERKWNRVKRWKYIKRDRRRNKNRWKNSNKERRYRWKTIKSRNNDGRILKREKVE